jgi:hypothetical protein
VCGASIVVMNVVLNTVYITARNSFHHPVRCNKQHTAHLEIATEVVTIIYMACHLSVEELHVGLTILVCFCMFYTQLYWHIFNTIPSVDTSLLVTHLLSRKAQEWEKLLLR